MKIKLTATTIATRCMPTDADRTYYWDESGSGFGIEVSRATGRKVFIVRKRHLGKLVKRSIGGLGEPWKDGHVLTFEIAKREAAKLFGTIASGDTPDTRAQTARAGGPTLREGLEIHTANMAITGGKGPRINGQRPPCSQRSIDTIRSEVEKYLAPWLDRPIVELTALELTKVCAALRKGTKAREGSTNPPGAALTKRLVCHVGAIWTSTDELHDLSSKNPALNVTTNAIAPKEIRIEPDAFVAWHTRVLALSPVRRDFQLLGLFTAIRSEGLRHLRWDDVEWEARLVHVTRAKGNRPYTIPMTATVEKILRERQRGNAAQFKPHGGDHGWVLPTLSRAKNEAGTYDVIPLAEAKEYELDAKTGERVRALLGPHALRKTWNSIAIEERIPKEDREALMNHEGLGVNVRHYGFPRSWEGLRVSAETVEAALRRHLELDTPAKAKKSKPAKRERHLRAVP